MIDCKVDTKWTTRIRVLKVAQVKCAWHRLGAESNAAGTGRAWITSAVDQNIGAKAAQY